MSVSSNRPSRVAFEGPYWSMPEERVLAELGVAFQGLSAAVAAERLRRFGPATLETDHSHSVARLLWNQIRSPLVLLLLFAAVVSGLTGEWIDATIVGTIVLCTVGIGFERERTAQSAMGALRARVKTRATALRDGVPTRIVVDEVVPGDIVLLSAGSLVPGDALVLEATDCQVSEAILTGESFPVEKRPGTVPADAPLGRRSNALFLGTNVRSGTAKCLVVRTGAATEFGAIAHRLTLRAPETEFDRGVRRFGNLLGTSMLAIVIVVVAAHVLQDRPILETLLFSIALAVGLSPELMPAILTVNLARGAERMAQRGVLVRRLSAIQNLGSMDILCTDKTGTLTEGVVRLDGAFDAQGEPATRVAELAAINASLQTGLPSPLDEAIVKAHSLPALPVKLAEVPFDFVRKQVSVVVRSSEGAQLITKGAFHQVITACSEQAPGLPWDDSSRARLQSLYEAWSAQGMRVLAVATRQLPLRASYGRADEADLTFAGLLTFFDRPKEGVLSAIEGLRAIGVSVKLITGDSLPVAKHVANLVGLDPLRALGGDDLDRLHDEALWQQAERTDVFAEVDPNQKERILLSLKKMGHVVGFLGDGINDAPAMHAADTSLSVDTAVDVARAAADFVLLESSLDVIRQGIGEGRKTFANTLKYVLTTTSANLGNMFSMAVASLFLTFLPLTAGQILLNNLISDIPAIGIAGDSVDPEMTERPRRWDMRFIGRFMVEFGLLSSVFDLLTFAGLLLVVRASPEVFRTAWFIESLLTELLVALVVRTRRSLFQSRPGPMLAWLTYCLIPVVFAVPFLPYAEVLGFTHVSWRILVGLALISVLYVAAAEVLKHWFYGRMKGSASA